MKETLRFFGLFGAILLVFFVAFFFVSSKFLTKIESSQINNTELKMIERGNGIDTFELNGKRFRTDDNLRILCD